ncbi:MAG: hypothetical protein FGF50_09635 [Candidatus Brockarchaeota archaeon]|nr:hypothetical protein [Candidatus Brockarchaeota archaeon]
MKRLSTRDIALVAAFSAIWIASETYFGRTISLITGVHGVIQRFLGWLLMLIMARITGRFGNVTIMATVSSLATRISRSMQIYALFVGLGYAVGGLAFDLLYFLPKNQKRHSKKYTIFVSLVSGVAASMPYVFLYFFTLGFYGFLIWFPTYLPNLVKGVGLSILGALTGLSVLPLIEAGTTSLRRE